jgi:hypothetical protein
MAWRVELTAATPVPLPLCLAPGVGTAKDPAEVSDTTGLDPSIVRAPLPLRAWSVAEE